MKSMENAENDKDEAKKAFARYLEEKKGEEIDPRAVEAGRKEIREGERASYAVYGDELTKEEKFKNDPSGHLFKTDLSREQLEDRLKSLTHARGVLVNFLESNESNELEITRESNLLDLIEKLKGKNDEVSTAIEEIMKNGYNLQETLYELPDMLKEDIRRSMVILEHSK